MAFGSGVGGRQETPGQFPLRAAGTPRRHADGVRRLESAPGALTSASAPAVPRGEYKTEVDLCDKLERWVSRREKLEKGRSKAWEAAMRADARSSEAGD
jgi:hypothetical protein